MGIVYGLVFNTALPTDTHASKPSISLETIDRLFKSSSLYRRKDLYLYGDANGKIRLVADGKILRTVTLDDLGFGYRLNPDETLQSIDYGHLTIAKEEFTPSFVLHCRKDGYLDPAILMVKEKWLYIHPFRPPRLFADPVAMVASIHQNDYLPDKAGYAR